MRRFHFDISGFRKFLKDNKIFFDVIVATLLSFMAVYVSIQSKNISENQATMIKQEGMPHLEILFRQERNDTTQFCENDVYQVYNRGGKLFDFDCYELTFMHLHSSINPASLNTLQIPIDGYLNFRGTLTGDADGFIYSVDTRHNGRKDQHLRDSIREAGYYDLNIYARISYTDVFEKKDTDYYVMNWPSHKISKEKWKTIESSYEANPDKFKYFFPRLKASELVNLIKTKG